MGLVWRIALEEWRYWQRSKLGLIALLTLLVLLLATIFSTAQRMTTETAQREHFQVTAESTFRDQPARHPHRMVHYGHYVTRVPSPLSIIDPGIDPYAGTIIFLEGHRQNSAAFSPRYSSAQAGPFTELTPALVYQILVPLLLVFVGFSIISREREAGTHLLLLTMATTPLQLWLGKVLALVGVGLITLIPLVACLFYTFIVGENGLICLTFFAGYALYLLFWVLLVCCISTLVNRSSLSLSALLVIWLLFCAIIPKLASSTVDAVVPLDGKVARDLEVVKALREVGDGHNANDPAFKQLRAQLLEQHNVSSLEELPFNFRGRIAQLAEAELTDIINGFAKVQQQQEKNQARIVHWFGVLSPALATRSFSVVTAGTDLNNLHLFLQGAESLRFEFVQRLNA
ncbi:MAG: DUF3526 domain-containing protein, partial [Pseudomonadales bacterium]|nr:DUF3526 domain-containing protein [Pseudomonadales bacterium]